MKTSNLRSAGAVVLSLVIVGILVPAAAQEVPRPFPMILTIRGPVEPAMMGPFNEGMQKIVKAHSEHASGNNWATYTQLTGGQPAQFYLFLPMAKMGDLDVWTPHMQIMMEALGPEEGQKLLSSMGKAWPAESLILAHVPEISNPSESMEGPPPYAMHMQVSVKPEAVFEYIGMVQKIVEANAKHDNGLNWVGYTNTVGGEGAEFHYWIAANSLADLERLPMMGQVMNEALGAEGWGKMQSRFVEIAKSHSEILVFMPTHSNMGG